MPLLLPHGKPSVLVIAGIALVALNRARTGKFGNTSSKLVWISAIAMSVLLRQLLVGKDKKFITNPAEVGRQIKDEESTAGCVLAARLSENPSVKVLLLEAGVSGKSLIYTRIPVAFSRLFHSKHVYNFYTEPQMSAQGKKKYWPSGKMLGGCSSINAQMAQYGTPADFDQWGSIIKDDAWSWENFRGYFTKFEKYVDDPAYPDVDSKVKGKDGPVRVGYFSSVSEGSKDFIKACIKLGIPYSADFNTTRGTRGVNRAEPELVVLHAQVTKIITEKAGDEITTTGVEFAMKKGGPRYRVRSKHDVIVAAGAVQSPQNPHAIRHWTCRRITKFNIPVVEDLPGPVVDIFFKNKFNDSPKHVKPHGPIEVFKATGSAIQYLTMQRGPFCNNFGESAAFCRSDDPVLFPESEHAENVQDSTSGSDSPDLEIFTTPFAYKEHGAYMFPMHTFALHVVLLKPMSTGTLRLKSADPWDSPAMDPRYLTAPEDSEKIKRGVKLILKISKAEPLASRLDHTNDSLLLDHKLHLKTDKELEEIIRERVETLYHPASTCRMAPRQDGGVVNGKLRVYGIKRLRVCDASIFPEIVSGHTAGAVLASAEVLADIITAEIKAEKKD